MAEKAKAVKQTDIARELNISVVSVSNALSGKKGVSDELRQRIFEVAEEMGYQLPAQQAQQSGIAAKIGVLIARRYLRTTPSFYMAVYQEIVKAATQKGCVTFLEILDAEIEKEQKLPELTAHEQIDGILVLGELRHPYTRILKEASRVPIIFVDYYEPIEDADFIISDGYTGVCRLTRKMLASGYRRIAFVGTIDATSSIRDRYFGYRKALMEQEIEIKPQWVIPDRVPYDFDVSLKLPEEMPDAFVCNCDTTAAVLIEKLRRAGYRVPEDIGVSGFDNFLSEKIPGVELSTCDVDIEAMAKISVNTLLGKIGQTHVIPGVRIVSGKLIYGNSF